jgi:hypothetical protein
MEEKLNEAAKHRDMEETDGVNEQLNRFAFINQDHIDPIAIIHLFGHGRSQISAPSSQPSPLFLSLRLISDFPISHGRRQEL